MPYFLRSSLYYSVAMAMVWMMLLLGQAFAAGDGKRVFVVFADNAQKAAVDENGFLQSARLGIEQARQKFDVTIEEFIQQVGEDPETLYARLADKRPDMIIGIGIYHVKPTLNVADRFQDIKFTVIDGIVPPLFPNSHSLIFKNQEGAFLAGVAAALATKSGKVGFVGGRDTPVIRNLREGFRQGVKYVRPATQIVDAMIGTTNEAWSNPTVAHALALEQTDKGADVIFVAAGASSKGALKAIQEKGLLGIGMDINQNGQFPGHVLTSVVKRVDKAVFEAIEQLSQDTWKPGMRFLGVADGYMDYVLDESNGALLTPAMRTKLDQVKTQIAGGKLKVLPYSE